jgi:hypothetical protein
VNAKEEKRVILEEYDEFYVFDGEKYVKKPIGN